MGDRKKTPAGIMIFLAVILVLMLVPFLWLLLSAFRPNVDLFNEPFGIPKNLSFEIGRASCRERV